MDWLSNSSQDGYTVTPLNRFSCALTVTPNVDAEMWDLDFQQCSRRDRNANEMEYRLIVDAYDNAKVYEVLALFVKERKGAFSFKAQHGDTSSMFKIFKTKDGYIVFSVVHTPLLVDRDLSVGFPYKIMPIHISMLISDLYMAMQQETRMRVEKNG